MRLHEMPDWMSDQVMQGMRARWDGVPYMIGQTRLWRRGHKWARQLLKRTPSEICSPAMTPG